MACVAESRLRSRDRPRRPALRARIAVWRVNRFGPITRPPLLTYAVGGLESRFGCSRNGRAKFEGAAEPMGHEGRDYDALVGRRRGSRYS